MLYMFYLNVAYVFEWLHKCFSSFFRCNGPDHINGNNGPHRIMADVGSGGDEEESSEDMVLLHRHHRSVFFFFLFACGWKLTSRSVRFVPGFVCMLYSCCSLAACVSCSCMNPVFTACRRPRRCVVPITTDAVWIGQTLFPSPVRSCLFLPRVVGHICAPKATSLVVVLPDWSIPNPRNPIGAVEQMVAWSSAC